MSLRAKTQLKYKSATCNTFKRGGHLTHPGHLRALSYFLYKIGYNNILRPIHGPLRHPQPPAQNLGVATPPQPHMLNMFCLLGLLLFNKQVLQVLHKRAYRCIPSHCRPTKSYNAIKKKAIPED